MLERAAQLIRSIAQQWLSATVWRAVGQLPLAVVLVLAVLAFAIAII